MIIFGSQAKLSQTLGDLICFGWVGKTWLIRVKARRVLYQVLKIV